MDELKNTWSGRTVLVTGATGLVGSALVKHLLAAGARVVALIRDHDPQSELIRSGTIARVSVVTGSLEDFWTLERAINEYETDTVFHLAAQPLVGAAHRLPLPTFESNIRGTYNLLEAARVHAGLVRAVVVASSDKAYGAQPTLPYVEDMPLLGGIRMKCRRAARISSRSPITTRTACRSRSPGAAISTAPAISTGAGSCRAPSPRLCAVSGR